MPVTGFTPTTVVVPEPDEVVTQTGTGDIVQVTVVEETVTFVDNDPCNIVVAETVEVVSLPEPDEMILVVAQGPQGAPGAPGVAEEEVPYAKRIDWVSDTVLYKGEAAVGTLDGGATWRIQRITLGADDDVTVEWADGVSDFTKTWTNRLSYTYS